MRIEFNSHQVYNSVDNKSISINIMPNLEFWAKFLPVLSTTLLIY